MSTISDGMSEDNNNPLPGTPDRDGASLRDAALSLLRATRAHLIRALQIAALRHVLTHAELTADDLRALVPIPPPIDPKVVGAAVRDLALAGIIRRVGYRASTRPAAHARPLSVWRLADAAGAAAWLADVTARSTD